MAILTDEGGTNNLVDGSGNQLTSDGGDVGDPTGTLSALEGGDILAIMATVVVPPTAILLGQICM